MTNKTTTLFGFTEVSVKLLDGTSHTVRVRQLPVRQMHAFLQAQDNEAQMIELACQLDSATVDLLAPESHELLIAKIEEVNADFFSRWVARLKNRTERLMPGVMEKRLSALGTSLPSAASKPA